MADARYEMPRLVELYDFQYANDSALATYVAMVAEFGGREVLDIGCGTGTFACLLAERGYSVIGLEPALASLEIARRKPYADRVRWVHGTIDALGDLQADLATLTGNTVQYFLTDTEWSAALAVIRRSLRPGGRLVFETRDPDRYPWQEWDRAHTYATKAIPGIGTVATWHEIMHVSGDLITYRSSYEFESDGAVLTSDSTLRFRDRRTVEESLKDAGFTVAEVRVAPDRPGRELVFIAIRPADASHGLLET
jgi:SAM-dependent methyltransferase